MLICISGKAGTGKNEVAQILIDNYNFVGIAFADKIKRIAQDIYGFSDINIWGPSDLRNQLDKRYPRKDTYLSVRYALTSIGDSGRDCSEDIWVKKALEIVEKIETGGYIYTVKEGLKEEYRCPPKNVVISDGRFKNELDAVKQYGGKLLRIKRNSTTLTGLSANHISEMEQEDIPDSYFDFIIDNSGTIEELKNKVDNIAALICDGK